MRTILDSLDRELDRVATLDSSLIFSEGTSAGLLSAQGRLQEELQKQAILIRSLQNSASTTRSTLQSDLQQLRQNRDDLSERYQSLQSGYQEVLNNYNEEAEQVVTKLLTELDTSLQGQGNFQLRFRPGSANLVVPDGYLFRSGSSSRLASNYELIMAAVARTMESHPLLKLRLEGHTDTEAGRIDSWSFAAARTARLARVLADDFYLSPSRLSAASYGEYAPLTSNATADGRATNRRIEFVFYRDLSSLGRAFQEIDAQLSSPD
ncbi:MAG: OmpA family protein [Bacteroidota bacterium]